VEKLNSRRDILKDFKVKTIELPAQSISVPIVKVKFPAAKDFTRSLEMEECLVKLYKKIYAKRERKGVHTSDLDFPRKSLFDKLYPEEPKFQDILRWIRGESMHAFFETIFKDYPGAEVEKETIFIRGGRKIYTRPDVLLRFTVTEMPIINPITMEFKSTMYELKDNPLPYEHWCQRLLNYMALYGTEIGVLTVQILGSNEMRCYISPRLNAEVIEARREMIFYLIEEFEKMWKKKENHFGLCPPWLCEKCRHILRCYNSMNDFAKRVQGERIEKGDTGEAVRQSY